VTETKTILKLKQPRRNRDERVPARRLRERSQEQPRSVKAVASPLRKAADQDDHLLEALRRLAPETWDPEQPRPLAVGIHSQIFPVAEPLGISRSAVRRFLTRWTSRPAYLAALSQPGAVRCDVDGRERVAVEQRHGRRARRRLEKPDRGEAVTPSAELPQARELSPTRESSPSRQ